MNALIKAWLVECKPKDSAASWSVLGTYQKEAHARKQIGANPAYEYRVIPLVELAVAPSREPQAQGEGMPGPNGTCKLASNYAPSRHNGSHPQYEDCLRWKADTGLVGGLAAAPSPEGEPQLDKIQQAENWLLLPENDLGQEREHASDCGKGVTNTSCELCRLSIMLPAFAQFAAAAPSREWIKRAAKEICDKGYCGTYDFVEEIIARHAAQQEGK